jgi:hypothetical protein
MVPDSVVQEIQLFADLGVSCAAAYESYDLTFALGKIVELDRRRHRP